MGLPARAVSQLDGAPRSGRIRLAGIALPDSGGATVDLELIPHDVFGPDALVLEETGGAEGRVSRPLPSDRYFIGSVADDPESWVYLAIGRTTRGFITTRGETWALAPPTTGAFGEAQPSTASTLRKVDPATDSPIGQPPFSCEAEWIPEAPATLAAIARSLKSLRRPRPLSSTVYRATIAFETDYELTVKLGSTAAVTTYIGDLLAASSAIYLRDVKVVLQAGVIHTWPTAADPWAAVDRAGAFYEFGDYWHVNFPMASFPRATAHFLSGKALGGGKAWIQVLCFNDIQDTGHWAGGYAISGSLNGSFSAVNPALYWDLFCFSHELGHNFSSPHTHCYGYGLYTAFAAVDQCYSGDTTYGPVPCYVGPTSVPAVKGTMMSYCHLLAGGYSNLKLFFGVAGEPSEAVTTQMRTYVENRAALPSSCLQVLADAPAVTAITPGWGSTAGGGTVTVTGMSFQSGATVSFGGTSSASVTFGSSTSLTAVVPAHAAGSVAVTVTNPDTQTGSLPNGYSYVTPGPATLSSIAPVSGSATGSDSVTISGTNFLPGAAVTLGGSSTTGVVVASPTTITALTPAHAAGVVDLVVTNPSNAPATLPAAFTYVVVAPSRFYPLAPCRLFDTRSSSGSDSASPILGAGEIRTLLIGGRCAVPANARAISVNQTVVGPAAGGELTLYRSDLASPPGTSNISFRIGVTRANNGILELARDGTYGLNVRNSSPGTVHFILDVNGYFR